MSVPSELSLEAVRRFMLENGGKVTNHDLVKHFKQFLTNPVNRVQAREHFKEIVNVVATIRTEEGEKFLVLKKKYQEPMFFEPSSSCPPYPTSPPPSDHLNPNAGYESVCSFSPLQFSHMGSNSNIYTSPSQSFSEPMSPSRAPPPYRAPPPPVVSPTRGPPPQPHIMMPPPPPPTNKGRPPPITALLSEEAATAELARQSSVDSIDAADEPAIAPPVPPRRKSSVKSLKLDNKENCSDVSDPKKRPKSDDYDSKRNSLAESEAEHKISVRDAMQKFNRLASENELQRAHLPSRKKPDKVAAAGNRTDPEDDAVSVTLLDPKSREWLVRASQCHYQILAKLSAENPRLATFKDPTSTALHWAAKHGNEDVIKLIAGTHQADVNVRSNGGYTPLHIAMQFGHEDIHNLLVQVYSADPNIRDWSGRKPRQYQMSQGTSVSADTFRKIKAKKKHAEKDSGFLRIGSLNVRVKRTTEAFSNFLGVGQQNADKIHKTWGSADNVQQGDRRMMPPPQFAPIKKRKSKRAQDFAISHSTPSTPSQPRASISEIERDSDSDTAAGFDSNWQN
ncbi:ankyrin repeat domain-containing protein SOWAHC isoform X2 [Thrips palmi]|uniref:Ankyrin repeat domain-containing protein SOWAHC isoform X2 n=1 Tax=Thrips palmi TaxID=161013 RepID=A0A6P9AB69_THRPL|nr:ankyrin repeat domain-containing protein SOWAHC isoform X2 [Thrips palmi]